jgi:predicted RNase H-like nuclease
VTVVAGCDVAAGRWIVVVLRDGAFAEAFVRATLREVAEACADAEALAVDIPIGLPEDGPRACDLEGRARLGRRRSTLFVTPVRAAIEEPDHAHAVALNRAATGQGVSRQAHGLRHMILDAASVAAADPRIHEAHPELSFAALTEPPNVRETPYVRGARTFGVVEEPKSTWDGLHRRIALLREAGIEVPVRLGLAVPPADVLDAAAVAWTAARIAAGTAEHLGEDGAGTIWI